MPRPDEMDHYWYNNDPSPEELHDHWHRDPPIRQTRVDSGARIWAAIMVIAWLLVCAWLAAPSILSAEAAVNGCDQYRTEMVACAEASR